MPQPDDRVPLFELPARPLGLTAEFILGGFDFLTSLREMLLLKPQPVFEDRSLVPQFRELLLALPSKCFLAFIQLGFFRTRRGFKISELLLTLCEKFVTNSGDSRLVDFAQMVEIGSLAISLCEELGADIIEFGAFANQRFTLGTQFGGEDFLGDVLSDSRFRSVEFEQLGSVRFVEQLPLSIEIGLSSLTIRVDGRERLLQSFPLSGNFAADLGQQTDAVGFELFAALCEISLLAAKLLDHGLLRRDLFCERRVTLPQNVLFGLQFLFGLLLPKPQFTSLVFELLKLVGEDLFAPVKLGEPRSEIIDQLSGVRQHLVVPWSGSGVEFRRRDRWPVGSHRVKAGDSAVGERHKTRRRLRRTVVSMRSQFRTVGLRLVAHSGSPFPGNWMGTFARRVWQDGPKCPSSVLQRLVNHAGQLGLVHQADRTINRLTTFEQDHGWDALNAILRCDAAVTVGVHFANRAFAGVVFGDLFNRRAKHLARAAPRSPEVDQHWLAALQNLRGEVGFRELQNISGHDKEPSASGMR